jgi:serine/threonine protein kinase
LAKWDVYESEENKGDKSQSRPPPGFNYRSDIYSLGVVMQNILNFILLNRDEYDTLYALIVKMLDPDYRNRPQLMEIQALLK